jgi:hypothetical protein
MVASGVMSSFKAVNETNFASEEHVLRGFSTAFYKDMALG